MKKLIYFTLTIIFILSPLLGQTWSAKKRLTWHAGFSSSPDIATISSSGIHLVWHDHKPGNAEIYYKQSTDGGSNWQPSKRLTWNIARSYAPSIAANSVSGLHVTWYDDAPGNYEIFYRGSTDWGVSWSARKRLSWNSGQSRDPSIVVDQTGRIHIAWQDDTHGLDEIYHKHSTDGGSTWSGVNRLTWNAGSSVSPSLFRDSCGRIHLVWQDNTPGNQEIFYKQSTDSGATWSGSKRLTWNSGFSQSPSLVIYPANSIHVVWKDTSQGNSEIFYKSSTDNGITWSALTRLTWNSGMSKGPTIAADSSNGLHVTWFDSTPGNDEIYYKHSTDNGASWAGFKRLTWMTGWSQYPRIATDSVNRVHVVWYDDPTGDHEIYYKNRK